MEDIFEKVYNLYMKLLYGLEIGYEMNSSDLAEISYYINLLYFMKHCNPTAEEMLLIADRYETVGSFIDEFDFDF